MGYKLNKTDQRKESLQVEYNFECTCKACQSVADQEAENQNEIFSMSELKSMAKMGPLSLLFDHRIVEDFKKNMHDVAALLQRLNEQFPFDDYVFLENIINDSYYVSVVPKPQGLPHIEPEPEIEILMYKTLFVTK